MGNSPILAAVQKSNAFVFAAYAMVKTQGLSQ